MSPSMVCDAIKHSTGAQLRALFDDVRVEVYNEAHLWYELRVRVDVRHRGKDYGYAEGFPIELFKRDGEFYDYFMREEFPRQVARSVNDMVMRGAL